MISAGSDGLFFFADKGVWEKAVTVKCIIFMSLQVFNSLVNIPCVPSDRKFLFYKFPAVFLHTLFSIGCPVQVIYIKAIFPVCET